MFLLLSFYPGSANDPLSKGYHWQTNYFCNLTSTEAVNGEKNPVYALAIAGMMILAASIAFFYYNHSQKINHQTYSATVKYCGIASMISVALVFTSHNLFTTIGGTFKGHYFYYTYFSFLGYCVCNIFINRERKISNRKLLNDLIIVQRATYFLSHLFSKFLFQKQRQKCSTFFA